MEGLDIDESGSYRGVKFDSTAQTFRMSAMGKDLICLSSRFSLTFIFPVENTILKKRRCYDESCISRFVSMPFTK